MYRRTIVYTVLVGLVYLHSVTTRKMRVRAVRWWALAYQDSLSKNGVILNLEDRSSENISRTLSKKQRRLVLRHPGTYKTIVRAARLAVHECRYQFKKRRWNCETKPDKNILFGNIIQKGCRETAFIHAITSGALTHTIARSCAEGKVNTCGCGKKPRRKSVIGNWNWGGCGDNIRFGIKFSRRFIDSAEKLSGLRSMMNLHNNEAGRKHIKTKMRKHCKCHGLSGSCSMRTCWMRLSSFRDVGALIKERFDGASMIKRPKNENANFTKNNQKTDSSRAKRKKRRRYRNFRFLQSNPNHKRPTNKDLVYFEPSPEFCNREIAIDFKGTSGRVCNRTSLGIDGCDLMCCGRGHHTTSLRTIKSCNCTFHWCCTVHCKQCPKIVEEHKCK